MASDDANVAAKELGAMIRERREQLRIGNSQFTLRQFATQLGISPTFLHLLEKGEAKTKVETLKQIAELLNLDSDELLALADKINPDLKPILKKPGIPAFLRTIDGFSNEQMAKLQSFAGFLASENNQ